MSYCWPNILLQTCKLTGCPSEWFTLALAIGDWPKQVRSGNLLLKGITIIVCLGQQGRCTGPVKICDGELCWSSGKLWIMWTLHVFYCWPHCFLGLEPLHRYMEIVPYHHCVEGIVSWQGHHGVCACISGVHETGGS